MKNRNGALETTLDNILTYKCWYIVYNLIIILRFVSILFLIYAMYCLWSISKLFLRTTSFHLANTAWSRPFVVSPVPPQQEWMVPAVLACFFCFWPTGIIAILAAVKVCLCFIFFADYLQFLDQDNYVALNKWDSCSIQWNTFIFL